MQVESNAPNIPAYSMAKTQADVKNQANISILKSSMELTQQLVNELQKSLTITPPPNPNGSISIYA